MHYKKNFLTKVIFKIDFGSTVSKTQDDELASKFASGIKETYPNVRSNPLTQISMKMSPTGLAIQQEIKGKVWEHTSKEKNKILILNPDFLLLEYRDRVFSHFPEFKDDMDLIYKEFQTVFDIPSFSRIGLRYINEIKFSEGKALDWKGFIKDSLVSSTLAGLSNDMKLTRSMHQFMAKHSEDISVLFQYGIFNPEYPNPVSRREFILDVDCFISATIEKSEVIERLGELNAVAEMIFEDSIDEELRREMEVIDG
jgi:uncharacterized protein (TIGR04255 family)